MSSRMGRMSGLITKFSSSELDLNRDPPAEEIFRVVQLPVDPRAADADDDVVESSAVDFEQAKLNASGRRVRRRGALPEDETREVPPNPTVVILERVDPPNPTVVTLERVDPPNPTVVTLERVDPPNPTVVIMERVDPPPVENASRSPERVSKSPEPASKSPERARKSPDPPRKSPEPPKERPKEQPVFTCPICMQTMVEETSTRCGHIFCKGCIKAAVSVQAKCPTCRKKIAKNQLIRVFLPAAN